MRHWGGVIDDAGLRRGESENNIAWKEKINQEALRIGKCRKMHRKRYHIVQSDSGW
jgi:hypothetical protein